MHNGCWCNCLPTSGAWRASRRHQRRRRVLCPLGCEGLWGPVHLQGTEKSNRESFSPLAPCQQHWHAVCRQRQRRRASPAGHPAPTPRQPLAHARPPFPLPPLAVRHAPALQSPLANSALPLHPRAERLASPKAAQARAHSLHAHLQASSKARGGLQTPPRSRVVGWRQLAFKGVTRGPETPWPRSALHSA